MFAPPPALPSPARPSPSAARAVPTASLTASTQSTAIAGGKGRDSITERGRAQSQCKLQPRLLRGLQRRVRHLRRRRQFGGRHQRGRHPTAADDGRFIHTRATSTASSSASLNMATRRSASAGTAAPTARSPPRPGPPASRAERPRRHHERGELSVSASSAWSLPGGSNVASHLGRGRNSGRSLW